MRIAVLSLENKDPDSAVNRAYYAMFNVTRAALLKCGVPEGELPRTHRGLNSAFRQHAVLPGRIDAELASLLGRAEGVRLMADYTGKEIAAEAAAELVKEAQRYVGTIERAFGLELDPLEEQRREGREEWLRLQQRGVASQDRSREGGQEVQSDHGLEHEPDES